MIPGKIKLFFYFLCIGLMICSCKNTDNSKNSDQDELSSVSSGFQDKIKSHEKHRLDSPGEMKKSPQLQDKIFPEVEKRENEGMENINPDDLTGFSSDGTRFAYTVLIGGTKTYLFTVIESESGRRITDFSIAEESDLKRVKAYLDDGFMAGDRGEDHGLFEGETIRIETGPNEIEIFLVSGEKKVRINAPEKQQEIMKRFQRPEADIWGFSSDGNYLALSVSEDYGYPSGRAVTFQLLNMAEARELLKKSASE